MRRRPYNYDIWFMINSKHSFISVFFGVMLTVLAFVSINGYAQTAQRMSAFSSADTTTAITHLDWDEMRIDTMLPQYMEVVPLESDYRLYDYQVNVLYPEWGPLTRDEQKAILPFVNLIADTLRIDTHIGIMRRQGSIDISFVPIICRDGHYQKLLSCKLEIVPQPKALSAKARKLRAGANNAERNTRKSVLSEGKWVKISITTDGMYRLTRSALQKMGFSKPENVRLYGYGGHLESEVLNPEAYYDDLEEVPLYKADNDTWVFWGNGLLYWKGPTRVFNPYANEACYFLTEGTEPGSIATIKSADAPSAKAYDSFAEHVLYEKDEFAWFTGGRNLYEGQDYATSNTHTYKLSTIDSKGDEQLTVAFTAGSNEETQLQTMVNGEVLSTNSLVALPNYTSATTSTKTAAVSKLSVGSDWTIKLTSTANHNAHLDYLALHYTRALKVPASGFIAFGRDEAGAACFNISNAPAQMRVMRIGQSGEPAVMIEGTKSSDTFSFTTEDGTQRFVAFDETKISTFPQPKLVGNVANQNLHALDSVDMVIIIPESNKLLHQAERLAEAHRAYDGLRVAVVRADQVYNEFSSGTPDATAYRLLMKMLYDRAGGDEANTPRYLLLMGDCAWDNRMLSPAWRNYSPKDYLLCFESENSLSDTKCFVMEDYFGLLDDGEGSSLTNDKVDLGIGRFPVTSANEARIMVDKCITYMSNQNAGSWKNVISILGDDGDNNEHMKYADDVAERIITQYPELEVNKMMWDAYTRMSTTTSNTYPDITSLIKDKMAEGVMMMNYTGHGATYCLSHEFVLKLEDFISFKSKHLPLWVTAACDVMPFDGQSANIGETAVLNEGGAALAFYGTTRTVYAYNNLQMNRFLCKYLFGKDSSGRRYRLGDAIRMAKTMLITDRAEVSNQENKLHYALLGDPALLIGQPTNRVVLDSINGKVPSSDSSLKLEAGAHVRMVGHVENEEGQLLNDFRGILSARVYDNLETITCKNNAKDVDDVFTFTNREKILYNGTDSVKSGFFELSFVVPADINYSNEGGRVVFYAINDSLSIEANGYNENFLIGGVSPSLGEDKEGPKIYAYLNNDDFENGGTVNATPYFVAHMEDASGISFSGNGLGHDLMLTIDNNPSTTYNLNDYYVGEFGDFTRGTVGYSIPQLSEGAHTLTFRAWDVLNNTNSTTLDFWVNTSVKPNMLSLTASQNPAITSTNFLISYDMPGTNCEFVISVYDFAGRVVWQYNTITSTTNGLLSVPWNLCNGMGGRLWPGIYLYKVTLKQGESKKVSETQKIIIANNN